MTIACKVLFTQAITMPMSIPEVTPYTAESCVRNLVMLLWTSYMITGVFVVVLVNDSTKVLTHTRVRAGIWDKCLHHIRHLVVVQ